MTNNYSVSRNIEIPMRDGVTLRGDLWKPDIAGQLPTILFRTPYNRLGFSSDFFSPRNAVDGGFAALVQDTRGRFASDGEWLAFDWEQEGRDTYDSVEWLAAQPWCTGAIGMAGPSYLGIVQLAGAALNPPHLRAIAPAVASVAKHERAEHGGALWLDHLFSWLCLMALDWSQRYRANGGTFTAYEADILERCLYDQRSLMCVRPLRESPLFKLKGFQLDFERLINAPATPDLAAEEFTVPILAIGGWFDFYMRGSIGLFRDARSHAARSPRYLLMGCWTHGTSLAYSHGHANFGLTASGAGGQVAELHLAFFRRHLCGNDVVIPAVRYFLMNSGHWRDADSWPPPEAKPRRFYLHSAGQANDVPGDGCLSSEPQRSDEPADTYNYDPADPPPTLGGRTLSLAGLIPGALDQASLSKRRDVLCYDTLPMPNELDLIGSVHVRLWISSSTVDTDFICKLIDIAPDGICRPITDGITRLRWRKGWDTPLPFPPDSTEQISVDLADTAWRVLAGHRLRLQIQSGNYPHLEPNMNTGAPVGSEREGVTSRNTVFHDEQRTSFVEFGCVETAARES